ncbi:MAG: hypothetical protein R3273_00355 [Pseudidiomarina maritima]|nr:hypothetical protein [Pseudidiomarina maritima]
MKSTDLNSGPLAAPILGGAEVIVRLPLRGKSSLGFVLLEVIIATVLLAASLLVFAQWQQVQQQQQQRHQWLADTERLQQAVRSYWSDTGQPPPSFAQLQQHGHLQQLTTPWQQPWLLQPQQRYVNLRLTAPSAAAASWLAGQIVGASANAEQVLVTVWQPAQSYHPDSPYLYRVAITDAPQLNQMNTDLDLRQHNLLGIDQLRASAWYGQSLSAPEAQLVQVQSEHGHFTMVTAAQAVIGGISMEQVWQRITEYQQLWDLCVARGGCQG